MKKALAFKRLPTPEYAGKPLCAEMHGCTAGPFSFVLALDQQTGWHVSYQDGRENPRVTQYLGDSYATRALAEGAANEKAGQLLSSLS